MDDLTRTRIRRYGVATGAVLLALLLDLLLWPWAKPTAFPLFSVAVLASAWYGGLGPGLLAAILSVIAGRYFFAEPYYRVTVDSGVLLRLAMFVGIAAATSYMAAARRRSESALRESEARFRQIADHLPGGAIYQVVQEPGGRTHFSYISGGVERMLGVTPSEVLADATTLYGLILEDDSPRMRAEEAIAFRDRTPFDCRFRMRTRGGEGRWVRCHSAPRGLPGGAVVWDGIMLDITDRMRAEEQRDALLAREHQARLEAEAANRAKDQFLAMLSHELRNPLTPVLMAATAALQDPGTPRPLAATFEMIRQNVELEARLIDDLLDVTRVMQGKMHFDWRVVDAHAAIRRAFDISRSDWQGKRIEMVTDLAATRHHVKADPARLQQVMWNLLKNAIKFTPEGGTITVRSRDEGERLVVEVADTGIGIEPGDLGRIFHAFEQVEDPRTRKYGGLGLGLAISRSIAEAHGGTLTASSPGRDCGATFRLELPTVAPVPAGEGETRPTASGVGPKRGYKLLLVEDDVATSRVMARLLRGAGHGVTTAGSVAEGLKVASADFELVVSDIGLPDGSGLDLMRRLKREYGLCGIALSGFGRDEDIARTREAGFVNHLTKPIDFARLEEAIRHVMETASC